MLNDPVVDDEVLSPVPVANPMMLFSVTPSMSRFSAPSLSPPCRPPIIRPTTSPVSVFGYRPLISPPFMVMVVPYGTSVVHSVIPTPYSVVYPVSNITALSKIYSTPSFNSRLPVSIIIAWPVRSNVDVPSCRPSTSPYSTIPLE